MQSFLICLLICVKLSAAQWVLIRTTDGAAFEAETTLANVKLQNAAGTTVVKLDQILSVHNAIAATQLETTRIDTGFVAIQAADRKARDIAVEELTNIGLPVLTPL